jgi:hypothetical protein
VGRRSGAKFNSEYKRLFGAAHGNDHVAQEKVADILRSIMGVIRIASGMLARGKPGSISRLRATR